MEGDIVDNHPPEGIFGEGERKEKREHRLDQEYLWQTRTLFWEISKELG